MINKRQVGTGGLVLLILIGVTQIAKHAEIGQENTVFLATLATVVLAVFLGMQFNTPTKKNGKK